MIKPNYEPPEFRENPGLEYYIEKAKEKYGIKLEKFYSRQHFEDFYSLVKGVDIREFFIGVGTFLTSWIGFTGLAGVVAGSFSNDWLEILGLFVGIYGASLGAVALCDNLLPRISSKLFNKNYKQYCESNNIPYDTI